MRDWTLDILIVVWALGLGLLSGMIYERYQRDHGTLTVATNARPYANPLAGTSGRPPKQYFPKVEKFLRR